MEELWAVPPEKYGADYQSHLLDQYRLSVEMADRISARRGLTNSFLLSVNALLVSGFGVLTSLTGASSEVWAYALPLAGLIVCVAWDILILRYRQINSAKFKVIHEIEKRLPAALFLAEWEALHPSKESEDDKGSQAYQPLTDAEAIVPLVFAVLYVALMITAGIKAIT